MSKYKQSKAHSTSSRPSMWSQIMPLLNVTASRTSDASPERTESAATTDTVEQRCQNMPVENTGIAGGGQRSPFPLPDLPGELRNRIFKHVCDDRLPYDVDLLQVDEEVLPDVCLSSVSGQIHRETSLYEGEAITEFLADHRFMINFKLEDLRERCTDNKLLDEFRDRCLQNMAIPFVSELDIIIRMPYPDSRPGKNVSLRIMILDKPDEDEQSVEFEATCERRDDDDVGKDEPMRLLNVLGKIEDFAQAYAQNPKHKLRFEAYGRVYLNVKSCVIYLHKVLCLEGSHCLYKLLALVGDDDDDMAVSKAQLESPHPPTDTLPTDFSETNSTAESKSSTPVPPEKNDSGEHAAMETQFPDCATSVEDKPGKSKISKGRQSLR
ncbi:uncharacterized protein MYCFIDRAFT_80463 [Pseudocercospora fijiensis CIRAD86]|uniref:Uncharacterized protein n=1 Tax=Pseudocercospora fijiensis (strain CIRAD86) TaxID=383855 RepID=M3B0D8_PSEFD|nr:uncharacterized protein MYCFIDRAFT_80463 [Pseudocercospora fijiensis CIRAD86]EME82873.1 hypothetical protein MYCFIDRAFT_80463 [Pseudocercospora fijiensis CIRAD86]